MQFKTPDEHWKANQLEWNKYTKGEEIRRPLYVVREKQLTSKKKRKKR